MTAKLRKLLRCRKGSMTVEIIPVTAVLILIFAVLVTALVYVSQYYSASAICRKATRCIEVSGQYNTTEINNLADEMGGDGLSNLRIRVSASYFSDRKIQLRDSFTVRLTATYRIPILRFGRNPVYLSLPIEVTQIGMSEVYWKR